MTTLLVIVPGRNASVGPYGAPFTLVVADTGEWLASHFCSNYMFAYGDLYASRKDRVEEWTKRFGEIEVKYIDETDITEEELIRRNEEWHKSATGKKEETV